MGRWFVRPYESSLPAFVSPNLLYLLKRAVEHEPRRRVAKAVNL